MDANELKATVREKYGLAALRAVEGAKSSCCGGGASCGTDDPITSNLYAAGQTALLPEAAVLASLGCGNPTALTELNEGEVVLDLGSGGGIDVLLSAHRVGPTGKAYGLDMTDEMLALARSNAVNVRAPPTSSSSRGTSRRSRSPTTRWTSSSPTASSTSPPTSRRCWPRRSGC